MGIIIRQSNHNAQSSTINAQGSKLKNKAQCSRLNAQGYRTIILTIMVVIVTVTMIMMVDYDHAGPLGQHDHNQPVIITIVKGLGMVGGTFYVASPKTQGALNS